MNILIELPTWLGDAVMATPAIESLLDHYDDTNITVIGATVSIAIFQHHPRVNKQFIFKKNYTELYQTTKNLPKFDLFISFRGSFRSRIFKWLINADKKYQFDKRRYRNRHQVEKYQQFLNESLGLSDPAGPLYIALKQPVTKAKNPGLGINPGASYGSAKRWASDKFAEVATALSDQYDITILGSKTEADIARDIEQILVNNQVSNYRNLAGKTSPDELIHHIAGLDLFITGDSGPMHLAAAFQVPTVAIFGPTKDYETSQWSNKKSAIVKKEFSCQPCMKRVCPIKDERTHHQCMKQISVDEVLAAVKNL